MVTKDAVIDILSGINDPELRKPLTELGMVKDVAIDGSEVRVGITLTVPGCPLKDKIRGDIVSGVSTLDGVEKVEVEFDVMTDEQRAKLREKLGMGKGAGSEKEPATFAKRFIAVCSGKGGVGKSTVTANLAAALARQGKKVGLLDADVYGFSIPHMLGVTGQPTVIDDKLVPLRKGDNLQVVSMGFFVNEDEAVVWRGPMLHKAINQFISDSVWDDLDYLLLDLPPGTGDVTITIAQAIPSVELLIVTTPQSTATHVASRVSKLAEKTNLKVVGVIENMAYYEVDGKRDYIFGQDGGKKLADKLSVALLGEIPLDKAIREHADNGTPIAFEENAQAKLFDRIATALDNTQPR